jgi:hypothetical protein
MVNRVRKRSFGTGWDKHPVVNGFVSERVK